jgi:hypothetical protein
VGLAVAQGEERSRGNARRHRANNPNGFLLIRASARSPSRGAYGESRRIWGILLGRGEPHGSFAGVPTATAAVLLPGGEQPISPAKFGGLPSLAPSLLPGIVGKYLSYDRGLRVPDSRV